MRPRVAIDLNIRVHGNETYAGYEDIEGGPVAEGVDVDVWEPESGIEGRGQITTLDPERRLAYLAVDWLALRDPRRPAVANWESVTDTSVKIWTRGIGDVTTDEPHELVFDVPDRFINA